MRHVYLNYNGHRISDPPSSFHHSNKHLDMLLKKAPQITVIIKREGHFLSGLDRDGRLFWLNANGDIQSTSTNKYANSEMYKKYINKLPRNYRGVL